MNVDDLINELEDLCEDLNNKKNNAQNKRPQNVSLSVSSSFTLAKNNVHSNENQMNIHNSQQEALTSQNKAINQNDNYLETSSNNKSKQTKDLDKFRQMTNNTNSTIGDGNIDDLLDILQSSDYKNQGNLTEQVSMDALNKKNDKSKQNSQKTTCLNPYLCNGNSEFVNDEFNMKKRVCNSLRCQLCNILITKMENYKWSKDADLLFFRNNFSRKEKLLAGAISDNDYSAYSCQCKGTSVNKLTAVSDCNMKEWRCTGHFD